MPPRTMTDTPRAPRALYLHGLESGPLGTKVITLRAAGFEVVAPQLHTAGVSALLAAGSHDAAAYLDALALPTAQGLDALDAQPVDVVVGSSFGAAVLARMILDPRYGTRPTVMLAGAAVKLAGATALPVGLPVMLVHGVDDAVVPVEDSRRLAATSPTAVLVEVHDDHRLTRTTTGGLLASLLRAAIVHGEATREV